MLPPRSFAGTATAVDFTPDPSAVVFMLGDGVNQYVNPKIAGRPLRATPHALLLGSASEPGAQDASRVWFGRMFLPPTDALSPGSARARGTTIAAMCHPTPPHPALRYPGSEHARGQCAAAAVRQQRLQLAAVLPLSQCMTAFYNRPEPPGSPTAACAS